jgi:hypothetical protein
MGHRKASKANDDEPSFDKELENSNAGEDDIELGDGEYRHSKIHNNFGAEY